MTTTHTFRVEERILRQLELEAETRRLSLNALHNHILHLYFEAISNTQRLGYISVKGELAQRLLAKADKKSASDLAEFAGKGHVPELVLAAGKELGQEGLMSVLERILCSGCGWARFSKEIQGNECIVTMTHSLGKVWSIFLMGVVSAAFEELAESKPQFKAASESVVVFRFLDKSGRSALTASQS